MKTKILQRLAVVASLGLLMTTATSCTTTYDANGNPVQSVDPGTAAAGAVAAGVLGYAIANNRNDNYYHGGGGYYRGGNYYRRGNYYRGGGRYYNGYHGGGHHGGRNR